MICWRSTGKTPIIELGEFRNRVGVLDSEYHRIAHLKERVIEHSIKQINEHTDITATYEQHKKGGQSQDFHSSLSRRSPNKPKLPQKRPKTATNDLDTIKPLTEPQIAKYSMILCKLGSISDLSNFPDYPTLPIDRKYPKKP